MPNPEFLESYTLYRKFFTEQEIPSQINEIPRPNINLYCKKCKSIQTFYMEDYWFEKGEAINQPSNGKVLRATYRCAKCKSFTQHYSIKISENLDYIMKVGQYPPWEISVDKELKKMLGDHEENYKKGLTCESQGYGIGAYAYYRRIVEEVIDELLDGIADLISGEDKEKYLKALEEAKKSHKAEDKIKIVKELLPPVLMPEGNNPLKLLYSQLSSGIHALSDEECLEKANYIRNILLFLVKEIISHRNSAKEFNDSIKGLLSKSK